MTRLDFAAGRFVAYANNRREGSILESCGGTYSESRGAYLLPGHFHALSNRVSWSLTKEAAAQRAIEEHLRQEAARYHTNDESLQLPAFTVTGLLPHQEVGAAFLRRFGRAILADDVGVGKTLASIAAVDKEPVLIVAPASVLFQWEIEVTRATGRGVKIIEGKTPLPKWTETPWHIVSYDVLKRRIAEFKKVRYGTVIADEAVRLKNLETQRARAFFQVAKKAINVFLLTATPIRNRPEELWAMLHCIDSARYPGFWAFANDFFEQRNNGFGVELGGVRDDRLDDWLTEIMPRVLRREREILNLPELTFETVFLPLDGPAERAYLQMERSFAALGKDGTVLMAPNVITQMIRLRQITSDPALCGMPGKSVKTQWLLDWLEDNAADRKCVVFSPFAEYIKILAEATKAYHPAVLTGDLSPSQRKEACRRLNEDDDCRLFLGTDTAAGEGLNLQKRATVVVFMGKSWTPDTVTQCIGRLHRQGQKSPVHAISLACPGTIDLDIEEVLQSKEEMATEALAIRRIADRIAARHRGDM